ncbi:uncharacterized protein LACBIDRAFT_308093 [Laccaria bicolor S238N-H82]|uniref:Predicted protein n=1 Tax=Laccaria bicolor (strain S238N-H82 / ATCC MYA-4686) TaxID=486041 RepID=B0DRM0_LACBS|nr:uncharacterized protein LACBIDRAFT_308093 [Laccaria bicolor S238N-H82]EDR02895.1 predicted protein [Laccaria bicolor S238N-H82]|eukprot:XP_001886605.1 predicted protein [Laccaria bicolor S238N-H82]
MVTCLPFFLCARYRHPPPSYPSVEVRNWTIKLLAVQTKNPYGSPLDSYKRMNPPLIHFEVELV